MKEDATVESLCPVVEAVAGSLPLLLNVIFFGFGCSKGSQPFQGRQAQDVFYGPSKNVPDAKICRHPGSNPRPSRFLLNIKERE
jgi:hypothetical protein